MDEDLKIKKALEYLLNTISDKALAQVKEDLKDLIPRSQVQVLVDALKFYADENNNNWTSSDTFERGYQDYEVHESKVMEDYGTKAREALKTFEEMK